MRVFDGHCDTAFELWKKGESLDQNSCHIDLKKCEHFEAYAQIFAFCSYAGTPLEKEPLLTLPLEILKRNIEKHHERISFSDSSKQIKKLHEQGRVAALLSLEGPELIACDLERLAQLREEGFRMTTLTWNHDNALAGCHLSDLGLSERGREFVRTAQQLEIYLDVSHLSDKAFFDLLDITEKPIVASHSNCRAWCPVSRNLTDDQLRQIAQTGGTVGLNLYGPFVGERADFSELRRHLEHMLRLCGEAHVALGGDLDGCDQLASGFEHVGNYHDFYNYLAGCGYEAGLLDQIFYQNLLKLF